jgi:hypothetical protein
MVESQLKGVTSLIPYLWVHAKVHNCPFLSLVSPLGRGGHKAVHYPSLILPLYNGGHKTDHSVFDDDLIKVDTTLDSGPYLVRL